MGQALQSAVTLGLASGRVYGTVWQIDGEELLVSCRADIAPDSHAMLEWELEGTNPSQVDVVRADVVVRHAREEDRPSMQMHHYRVELRVMSDAHRRTLHVWLAARQPASVEESDQSTDMVFRDLSWTLDALIDERPTDQSPAPVRSPVRTRPSKSPATLVRSSSEPDAPSPVALSNISTRHVRGTRALADVDAVSSRVVLEWRSWGDLEADWVATLSYGVLYIPSTELAIDTTFVVIAHLPDGRKALLSGRVGPQVRGITCLELSMGEQTRALFTTRAASARVPVGR